ncbi:MAG: tetratricopeptide repeat protein, partial [Desulfovibrionales bacterium]|nr:tetratricopeptide repeat protein [Desulfovibrionales bacterium]
RSTKGQRTLVWILIACVTAGFALGAGLSSFKSGGQNAPEKITRDLEARVQEDPRDLDAWIHLGNLYFDTDQYTKSIKAYARALELDPNNANVITDMGVMYRRANQPQKAVETFDRAIETDPTHEKARMNKGIVLFHDLDDLPGAMAAWEGLLAINPYYMVGNGMSLEELVKKYK